MKHNVNVETTGCCIHPVLVLSIKVANSQRPGYLKDCLLPNRPTEALCCVPCPPRSVLGDMEQGFFIDVVEFPPREGLPCCFFAGS